jgi:hypothetical protein
MTKPIYPTAKSLKEKDELSDYGKEIYPILDEIIALSKEWFKETKKDRDNQVDENYICGCKIKNHCFDIDIWDGRKLNDDNKWHCEIIECYEKDGFHCRGYREQSLWSFEIKKKKKKKKKGDD